MFYNQKVKIKNTPFNKVVDSFHDLDFVKFLITLQPVKIIKWAGILDGDRAHFMFWFFGWKDFKVVHKNYTKATKNFFCFTDYGQNLPLGLIYWNSDQGAIEWSKDAAGWSEFKRVRSHDFYPCIDFIWSY